MRGGGKVGWDLPGRTSTHFALVAAAGGEADVPQYDVGRRTPVVHRDPGQEEDGEGGRVWIVKTLLPSFLLTISHPAG